MATVNKDFKIKSGLIVEGTTATVNGFDVLTKKTADQDYIVNLIGGTATSANTPNTVVKRDGDGDFAAGTITADLFVGDLDGQAATVDSLSGHTTTEISEGSNLYFTNQRALDATNAAYDAAGAATSAQANAATYTDGKISTEVTNRNSAIATAKGEAISSSNGYTDSAISTEVTNRNSAISTAKGEAISTSEGYTDSAISSEVTNRNSAISSAISTEVTNRNSAISTAKSEAISSANSYTDGEIAALVDSAPALLDTLNELAAAIADNPNYATDVANLVATKADTTYVDSEISGLDTAAQGYATTAENNAKSYADTVSGNAYTNAVSAAASDATTKAGQAESNANDYTDSAIGTEVSNRNSAISTAISTEVSNRNSAISSAISTEVSNRNSAITSAVDAINTDAIEEGTSNKYFTDARAKASAADLLTGATKTNITITGTGAGLTITAENGVADSTTSDLAEGTNLYFTNARAVSAVQAVVPNFTSVDLNSVAKQVAATLSAPTAGVQTAHAFAKADYRSAEYLVKVAYGTHTEISKVLLTLDTSDNIAITEYGIVGTNGSASSISAGISGSNVQLLVTTANNNSTVTVMGTLLK